MCLDFIKEEEEREGRSIAHKKPLWKSSDPQHQRRGKEATFDEGVLEGRNFSSLDSQVWFILFIFILMEKFLITSI